jgi:predicted TIM-barrel fold metal-dependent hydrolase
LRIDSHVSFSPDHPPDHLQAILARNRFDGAILVVNSAPFPETGPHIAGILARLADASAAILDEYHRDPRFRGVCASLADGAPAIAQELARRGLPLDVEMRPEHFPALLTLAERLPDLHIAIDHLARPNFQAGPIGDWLRGMESAAALPNVFCKISGLLSGIEPLPWKAAPIRPFVQHALAVFGPHRLMFGSDWPVRLPDVTWKENLAAFTQSIGAQTMEVREQLLGGTAAGFYRTEPCLR